MSLDGKVLFDKDISLTSVLNKKVGIVGYGNQGRAQALNLRDSGIEIMVGLRNNSASIKKVTKDSLKCTNIDSLIKKADIVSIMIPDNTIDSFLDKKKSKFRIGQTILVSHGSSIIYGKTKLPDFRLLNFSTNFTN